MCIRDRCVSADTGLVDRGWVARWAAVGGRRALDSTVFNDAVATQDTITQLAECLLRQAGHNRAREFGIHESDGAPDEKEGRPKREPPGYQACIMCGEMWPRRQETFPA